MADVITELRRIIQDLVTPDLKAVQAEQKALSARLDLHVAAIEKRFDLQAQAIEKRFDLQAQAMELQHQVTMTTLEAFRAEMRSEMLMLRATNQMDVTRAIAPVSERVAKLEAAR